jgi:putative mycofactocin binding protein MftB
MACAASTDVTILDESWVLSPGVALRAEPFGALAYHFGNRKLTFLKTPALVAVVRTLGEHDTVRAALARAGVPAIQHAGYADALEGLASTDVIRPQCQPALP